MLDPMHPLHKEYDCRQIECSVMVGTGRLKQEQLDSNYFLTKSIYFSMINIKGEDWTISV